MLPILLALITSFGYGTGDFFAGRVAQRLSPVLVVLYVQSAQSLIVLIFVLLTRQPYVLPALFWSIGAGFLNAFGLILYYQALKIGRAGLVTPIVASSAVVPVAVSIVRGAIPSFLTVAGLVAVILGIVTSTVAAADQASVADCASPPCRGATRFLRNPRRRMWQPKTCIMLSLLATLAFGVFFILVDQGSSIAGAGILWVTFGVQVGALPITFISALRNRGIKGFKITNSSLLLALGVITVLNLSADASLTYALTFGNLGIVSVLASLGPVVTSLFARFVSAERLSRVQLLGGGLVLLGTLIVVSGN